MMIKPIPDIPPGTPCWYLCSFLVIEAGTIKSGPNGYKYEVCPLNDPSKVYTIDYSCIYLTEAESLEYLRNYHRSMIKTYEQKVLTLMGYIQSHQNSINKLPK